MLLEVLLGGRDELDGSELEAVLGVSVLHAVRQGERWPYPRFSKRPMISPTRPRCCNTLAYDGPATYVASAIEPYLDTVRLDGDEAVCQSAQAGHSTTALITLRLFGSHDVLLVFFLLCLKNSCQMSTVFGAKMFEDGR